MNYSDALTMIAMLNNARSQGEWHGHSSKAKGRSFATYLAADGRTIADFRYKNGEADLAFAMAAPLMAEVIAEQHRRLKFAIEVLEVSVRNPPSEEAREAVTKIISYLQSEVLQTDFKLNPRKPS